MKIVWLTLTMLVVSSAVAQALPYTCYLINPLPGRDFSEGVSINNNGIVLVSSGVQNNDPRGAFTWSMQSGVGYVSTLGTIDAPRGINNTGQIVGNYDDGTGWNAVIRNADTTLTNLARLYSGAISSAAAINDKGHVVGSSGIYATLWQANEAPIAIGGTLNSPAVARAINENGQVLYTQDDIIQNSDGDGNGNQWTTFANRRSYIWKSDGTIQQLEQLVGSEGIASGGRSINDSGQVVGSSDGHAILWNPDGSIASDLGIGAAFDINNIGQVVGIVGERAVLWEANGSIVDLPIPDGWTIAGLNLSINDNGQIAGTILDQTTNTRNAVLWQPVPEPSSLVALACGLVGILAQVRKRRSI